MKTRIFLILFFVKAAALISQPAFISMPTSSLTPTFTLQHDTYVRAKDSIVITPNFTLGFVTTPTISHLVNLNISPLPGNVNNNYVKEQNSKSSFPIDLNRVAGTTEGVFSVNQVGELNYNIPIVCSPGTAGMQPDIAVTYNSNGENTWLGTGFNLAGISSISRTGKTVFYDGMNGSIKFDGDDVYSLEGDRMLLASGTYSAAGATYKMETENYNSIKSYGTFGSGPEHFIVNTRDGRTIEYGNSSDSRNTDKTNSEILHWCINKVTDAFGNFMVYHYTNVNGEMLIDNIQYTGNGSFNPYNKISFAYIDRSDNASSFFGGKEFARTKLLKSIICADINGKMMRKYTFDYEYHFGSYLNHITEVDALGNQLNPTYFDWTSGGATVFNAVITANPSDYFKWIPADMDGDGKTDLVGIKNASAPSVDIKINSSFVFTSIPSSQYVNSSIDTGPITLLGCFVTDEDNDNRDEVFIMYTTLHTATIYQVLKLKYNGSAYDLIPEYTSSTFANQIWATWVDANWRNPYANFNGNTSSYAYNIADVTGDNVNDKIITDQNGITVIPSNDPNPFLNAGISTIVKAEPGDFNNDGTQDIFVVSATTNSSVCNIDVYGYDPVNHLHSIAPTATINLGNNPNIINWNTLSSGNSTIANAAKSIGFGDMDGDHKTDVFFMNYNGVNTGEVNVMRSNGIGFEPAVSMLAIPLSIVGNEASFFVQDVNNDGKSDFCATAYYLTNKTSIYVTYPSDGNSLFFNNNSPGPFPDESAGAMGDFDGDGSIDYVHQWGVGAGPGNGCKMESNVFDWDVNKRVEYVYNLKNTYKAEYAWLPSADIYSTGTSVNAGYQLYKPGMFVVRSINDEISRPSALERKYTYTNGLLHKTGRGFLGFETITFTPPYDLDRHTITTNFYNTTQDYITSTQSTVNDGTVQVSKSVSSYSYVTTGTNRYLNSSETASKDYLSSTNSKSIAYYDNANGGQILGTTSAYYDWSGSNLIRSDVMEYTYSTITNTTYGTPIDQMATSQLTKSDGTHVTAYETDYSYDTPGRLIKKIENSNLAAAFSVTTSYGTFNPFGAPTTVSVSGSGLTADRTAGMLYDNTGRFIISSTNALGNTETATYDALTGDKLSATDISGLTSKYTYDGLGRLLTEKLPNTALNTLSYNWHGFSPPLSYFGSKVISQVEGAGSSTTTLDYLDRTVTKEADGFGGTETTNYQYNNRNAVTIATGPIYAGQTNTPTVTYSFDIHGRPSSVVSTVNGSSGGTQTYEYNPESLDGAYSMGYVKVSGNNSNSGQTFVTRKNNEAGQVTKVINGDDAATQYTANYTFNQFDQPVSVSTAFANNTGNSSTTFEYDVLGRRTKMTDPSAGISTYSYNSVSEVTLQSTPSGTYTYAYDVLGRLLTKTGSDQGTTTYSYVSSGNGIQQVSKITGQEVISEYAYDHFGRTTQEKETLINTAGKVFTTSVTYDKYNRLLNYTYPNGFVTTNEYDVTGNLTKIKNNTTVLWQLNTVVAPGVPGQYTYGNGLSTTLDYDTKFNLKSVTTGTLSKQTYSMDAASSNLLSRSADNYATGISNNDGFQYDNLNRLISRYYTDPVSGVGNITDHYSYEDDGNLTHKTDCGDYTYVSGHPYKLDQVINATSNLPSATLNMSFNDLNKISETDDLNGNKFNFTYGNDGQRIKMDYLLNSLAHYSRYYQTNYDRQENSDGTYKDWCYVFAPTGLCAIRYNNNGSAQTLYATADQLGSPLLLTTATQSIAEESSFDAWGRRRDPADWNTTLSTTATSSLLIRGFEMHELLNEVGIINMNGRLYDPVLGRFVQADNYIQDPDNLQNFNRFSYCFNNPLKFTDPSGYKSIYVPDTGPSESLSMRNMNPDPWANGIYVDGILVSPIHGGGGSEELFWGGMGTGAGSVGYYGFIAGSPNSHLNSINADLLANAMHTGNENSDFNIAKGSYVTLVSTGLNQLKNPVTGQSFIDSDAGVHLQWTPYDWANGDASAQDGWDRFQEGFINSSKSDMGSGSSFAGYAGLQLDKTKALLEYTAENASGWANKASALRAAKVVSKIGKGFGIAGAVFTGVENALDGNGFTFGDGVKVGIGLLTTFTPIGWTYGIVDISVGIFTGSTLTDRIGAGIDKTIK